MIAPALSSPPSMPSVSAAIAKMPRPPIERDRQAEQKLALRPPRPLPRTVTVVSPPEMIAQGGATGWPWTATWQRDAGDHLAALARLALDRIAEDERAVAGARARPRPRPRASLAASR